MLRESSSSLILFTNLQTETSEKYPSDLIHILQNKAHLFLFMYLHMFITPTPH